LCCIDYFYISARMRGEAKQQVYKGDDYWHIGVLYKPMTAVGRAKKRYTNGRFGATKSVFVVCCWEEIVEIIRLLRKLRPKEPQTTNHKLQTASTLPLLPYYTCSCIR
jgi:hypothetical protein